MSITEQGSFSDFLADRNRSTSLHAVIADSVEAYSAAFASYHGTDASLDLLDSAVRKELSDFIHDCAEAVEEPENPQFPVRR